MRGRKSSGGNGGNPFPPSEMACIEAIDAASDLHNSIITTAGCLFSESRSWQEMPSALRNMIVFSLDAVPPGAPYPLWSWEGYLAHVRALNIELKHSKAPRINRAEFPHDEADVRRVVEWRKRVPRGAP